MRMGASALGTTTFATSTPRGQLPVSGLCIISLISEGHHHLKHLHVVLVVRVEAEAEITVGGPEAFRCVI